VLVTLPNFGGWQRRRLGEDCFHLDLPRHRAHFTPAGVESALRAGDGLEVCPLPVQRAHYQIAPADRPRGARHRTRAGDGGGEHGHLVSEPGQVARHAGDAMGRRQRRGRRDRSDQKDSP
jgi:hypothetical protein